MSKQSKNNATCANGMRSNGIAKKYKTRIANLEKMYNNVAEKLSISKIVIYETRKRIDRKDKELNKLMNYCRIIKESVDRYNSRSALYRLFHRCYFDVE